MGLTSLLILGFTTTYVFNNNSADNLKDEDDYKGCVQLDFLNQNDFHPAFITNICNFSIQVIFQIYSWPSGFHPMYSDCLESKEGEIVSEVQKNIPMAYDVVPCTLYQNY